VILETGDLRVLSDARREESDDQHRQSNREYGGDDSFDAVRIEFDGCAAQARIVLA